MIKGGLFGRSGLWDHGIHHEKVLTAHDQNKLE